MYQSTGNNQYMRKSKINHATVEQFGTQYCHNVEFARTFYQRAVAHLTGIEIFSMSRSRLRKCLKNSVATKHWLLII